MYWFDGVIELLEKLFLLEVSYYLLLVGVVVGVYVVGCVGELVVGGFWFYYWLVGMLWSLDVVGLVDLYCFYLVWVE